ncbi:MAG: GYF domain-containing protein [Kiritimatiellaeota bacterium]|nr:GYF domain-containing protein [Kiritimatiellota bacterium]
MNSASQPETWHLETGNGQIFGPVTLSSLQRWAVAGRVTPDALVSPDQSKWKPAYLLDALNMNCVVRIRPGTFYGPVHAGAVEAYMRDGVIPQNATLYTTRPAQPIEAELDESARQLDELEARIREAQTQSAARHVASLRKAEKQLAQSSADLDAANAEIKRLLAQAADAAALRAERDALLRGSAEVESRLAAARAEIKSLAAQAAGVETLRADLDAARGANDALNVELELLRDKQAATEQALAQSEAGLGQFRATVHTLTEKLRRLTLECSEPQPFAEDADPPPAALSTQTFDPTVAEGDSPLARLEAQARAELAKLKNNTPLSKLFKKP